MKNMKHSMFNPEYEPVLTSQTEQKNDVYVRVEARSHQLEASTIALS